MRVRILKQGYWVIAIAVVLFLCVAVVAGSDVMVNQTSAGIAQQAGAIQGVTLVVTTTTIPTTSASQVSTSLTTSIPTTQAPQVSTSLTTSIPTTSAPQVSTSLTTSIPTTQAPQVSTSLTTSIPTTSAPLTEVSTSLPTPTPTQVPQIPVLIESNPQGAQFWVDSVYRGLTPISVVLEPGPHKFLLQKTGYQDYSISIYYPSPTALGTFTLKPLTTNPITMTGTPEPVPHVNLHIDSNPQGAYIWVDSVDTGLTPISINVTRGVHSILLKKTGYKDYNISFDCQGDSLFWTFPLVQIPEATQAAQATLTDIRIRSIPPVARLLVDSRNIGDTPTNVTIGPGQHNIQLQKTGFRNYAGIFTFAPGQSWTFALDPENGTVSSARTGGVDSIVEIYSVPSGAQVLMDQWDCGNTPANIVTSVGPHSILLRKAGFEDYIENVSIYRDTVVSYSLEPVVTSTTPTTIPTPATTKASFPATAPLVALVFVACLFIIGRFRRGA